MSAVSLGEAGETSGFLSGLSAFRNCLDGSSLSGEEEEAREMGETGETGETALADSAGGCGWLPGKVDSRALGLMWWQSLLLRSLVTSSSSSPMCWMTRSARSGSIKELRALEEPNELRKAERLSSSSSSPSREPVERMPGESERSPTAPSDTEELRSETGEATRSLLTWVVGGPRLGPPLSTPGPKGPRVVCPIGLESLAGPRAAAGACMPIPKSNVSKPARLGGLLAAAAAGGVSTSSVGGNDLVRSGDFLALEDQGTAGREAGDVAGDGWDPIWEDPPKTGESLLVGLCDPIRRRDASLSSRPSALLC